MRWFTSDLHIGHRNIIEYCERPWEDVPAMNEGLVANWNSVVSDDDEVFVIGDLALGRITDSMEVASRLRGKKYLIPGNHDRCWDGHRHKPRQGDLNLYINAGFTILPSRQIITLADQDVLLCHFPYDNDDRHGLRYTEFYPENQGMWLIHGHIHNGHWRVRDKQINVGVDEWHYAPISEHLLASIIREKS